MPSYTRNAIIYQIFPDRFKDGDPSNNVTQEGQKFTFYDYFTGKNYTLPGDYLGQLIQGATWDTPVTSWATVTMTNGGQKCGYVDSLRFYGGDLEGIIQELDYLKSLGITAIYLNPIFASETTHHYDPASYHSVDPRLGDAQTFKRLTEEAAKRGIRIINDITPDHSGDDSIYFDVKGAYETVGAHESIDSAFFDWYKFTQWPDKWVGWGGFSAMPIIDVMNPEVQDFFLSADTSVMKYWHGLGSSGWRVDVAMQVPMGFARAMRRVLKGLDPNNIMIAEVWDHYDQVIPMLLGDSYDSAMNYRVRSLLIGDWDNDHVGTNPQYQGFFLKKDMTQADFWSRYLQIKSDYAPEAFFALMNLVDSHDAARPLYYLSNAWGERAKDALKALSFFLYTIPGAPTTLYGDEAGATNGGSFGCNQDRPITDDPFMRVPFPWGKEDKNLQAWYANLGKIRNAYTFLRTGEIQPLSVEGSDRVIAYLRYDNNGSALAVFNGTDQTQQVTVDLGYYARVGSTFTGLLGQDVILQGSKAVLTLQPFEARLAVTTDSVSKAENISVSGTVNGQEVALSFTGPAVVEKRNLTTGEATTLKAENGLVDVARAGHSYLYTVRVLDRGLWVATGTYSVQVSGSEPVEPPIKAEEGEQPSTGAGLKPIGLVDPTSDDYGPGWYKYPTASVFRKGDFDLLKFEMSLEGSTYTATYTVGNIDNCWGSPNGLSKATYLLFIDNNPYEGTTQGIQGLNANFAENFKWDVALQVEGWVSTLYKVDSGQISGVKAEDAGVEIKGIEGAPGYAVVKIPTEVIGELTPESKMAVLVVGQDGYGPNRIRQVTPEAQEWRFGGGNEQGTSPTVIDMIAPEGMTQEDILNYKAHAVAIPGISLAPYFTGGAVQKVTVLTPQDGTVTNKTSIDLLIKVLVADLKEVSVGGGAYPVSEGQNTIAGVPLTNEGQNIIEVKDSLGNTLASVKVVRDTTPPVLSITKPTNKALLTQRVVAVDAQSEPNVKAVLELLAPGGRAADTVVTNADKNGRITVAEAFRAFGGLNILRVTVTDGAGNQTTKHVLFAYGKPHQIVLKIGSTSMEVNVDTVKLDAAPYIKNSRTMVPLRALAESLGAEVQWDGATRSVTAKLGDTNVRLVVGSNTAYIDGKPVTLDVAPEIKNSRTFVPVRFITEAFGCSVGWNGTTRTVTITYP